MILDFFRRLHGLVSDDGIRVYAPVSGKILPIEDVPDVVFSERIAGDGIAIKPEGDKLVAPFDGTIVQVFETNHAFAIRSEKNIEVLVHFGIDTVDLRGKGFKRLAESGQKVHKGDPIIGFNLKELESSAHSTVTPVVISNMGELEIDRLNKADGDAVAGETAVLTLFLKEQKEDASANDAAAPAPAEDEEAGK
ncbi:MAG: PTS glucose transporter subunit IIA [Proteobacteria bacterium]|nr:PTS glucose transporter subunit IIA [Pseudomonadota bacterium]MDD6545312.1 PTS glucose transporter subunit IIA [Pseudomonadota bacterium]